MSITEKEKILFGQFRELDKTAKRLFEPYQAVQTFGDTSFSLMYAWGHIFHYAYREFENGIVVLENGMDHRLSCILLRKNEGELVFTIKKLYDMFHELEIPLYFDYVCLQDLHLYKEAAEQMGKMIQIDANEGDSDYLYRTKDFVSLQGKSNKGKRGDLNVLAREYPDIRLRFYDGQNVEMIDDCKKIFEQWCAAHSCEDCFYGCEKEACFRFFDIFDKRYHQIAVSYAQGRPLSFAVSEKINADTVCYYFQKNAARIRGLTYWLNREMALRHLDIANINLGEDMGIPGLIEDKKGLHPFVQKKKFFVKIL